MEEAIDEGGGSGRLIHDRRGQQHGQDACGEEHLVAHGVEQAGIHGGTGQYEGKFSDLGQTHGRENGRFHRIAHGERGGQSEQGFQNDKRRSEADDAADMPDEELHVQEHAHGDEEQAGENFLEGKNALKRVEAVFGAGEKQPGQKGAQRKRKSEVGCAHGNGEAQTQTVMRSSSLLRVYSTCLMIHGTTCLASSQPPPRMARRAHRGKQKGGEIAVAASVPGQKGNDKHHGHDGDVLKDHDCQNKPPVGRF